MNRSAFWASEWFRIVAVAAALGTVASGAGAAECGQPASNGPVPLVRDALFVLNAAVGARVCDVCICDVDASGSITASDARRVLSRAVGGGTALNCPPCDTETTTTTTTTTLPPSGDACTSFPRRAGESWTYNVVGTSYTYTSTVVSVPGEVNGYPVFKIVRSDNPPGLGVYIGCDDTRGLLNVATDWWDLFDPSEHGTDFWLPPQYYCAYGNPIGTECRWSGTSGGDDESSTAIVVRYEDVTVPAGTFRDVMVMNVEEFFEGELYDSTTYWLDRDALLVKGLDHETNERLVLTHHNAG